MFSHFLHDSHDIISLNDDADSAGCGLADPAEKTEASGTPNERPFVLCIDDDEDFSHGVKLCLQSRGYEVVRVSKGIDGYRLAFELAPIVILLDLHMPGDSGEEILSQLRFHPATSHIPVMIVTGNRDSNLRDRMIASGATEVLQKPLNYDQLAKEVAKFSP